MSRVSRDSAYFERREARRVDDARVETRVDARIETRARERRELPVDARDPVGRERRGRGDDGVERDERADDGSARR
jgi:hypothetical protein